MSKEEFLKIQTCVLKVNIHCDGCKQKVKKILQKIDGVYTTKIDSEQGKVTVSGNVDPATLIKKLTKNGKHAEIWGAPKPPHNHLNNHFKNLQIDHNNKPGNNNKQPPHHKGGGGGGQKGGGGGHVGLAHNPQLQQQLQQLQQIKGLQDLKLPPQFMKDMKIPQMGGNPNPNPNPNQKKVELMEDDGMSDDEYDDDDYDDDLEDDEYDDDLDDLEDDLDDSPLNNKMKPPMIGNGSSQMPNMLMNNMMMKGQGGVNGGGMVTKGNVPVQINLGGGGGGGGGGDKGGKKGGGGGNVNGNQNQGGGKGGKNGGGQPQDIKIGGGSGGQNKNGGGGGGGGGISNFMANGAKKGGGMNDGSQSMPNMMSMNANGNVGHMGNMPMAHMGNTNLPMGNLAAVQGLPAMNGAGAGAAGGAGYFPGSGPDQVAGNPFYQQQMAAMMMNQQRANGNERFQPMMYARPPPAVNYMPPPYAPYPYPPPPGERADQYAMFSDENTASCTVM